MVWVTTINTGPGKYRRLQNMFEASIMFLMPYLEPFAKLFTFVTRPLGL
jgi:hypothetical protein